MRKTSEAEMVLVLGSSLHVPQFSCSYTQQRGPAERASQRRAPLNVDLRSIQEGRLTGQSEATAPHCPLCVPLVLTLGRWGNRHREAMMYPSHTVSRVAGGWAARCGRLLRQGLGASQQEKRMLLELGLKSEPEGRAPDGKRVSLLGEEFRSQGQVLKGWT